MLLSIQQLSQLINYTERGTRYLTKRLNLPLTKNKNKWYFNTSQEHPFALSIRLQNKNKNLQIFYSIKDLSELHHQDKKTILRHLQELSVPLHGLTKKKYVYCWELYKVKEQLGKTS